MVQIKPTDQYFHCYHLSTDSGNYLVNFRTNTVYRTSSDEPTWQDLDLEMLIYHGVFDEFRYDVRRHQHYNPTTGTLLLTSYCNLACIYCYAENPDHHAMSFPMTKRAVDFLVKNAIAAGRQRIKIRFHGAGEPTLNWDVLVRTTEYARKASQENGLDVHFSITTNGVMTDDERSWLGKHMQFVSLSFDGKSDTQNMQRPHPLLDTYEEVMATLQALRQSEIPVLVQTTVTNNNVAEMAQWASFLGEYGVHAVNFQPVSPSGRTMMNGVADVDPSVFVANYLLAREAAEPLGINVVYSGLRHHGRDYYCGAYGSNFVVTPSGLVSTCYEVFADRDDPPTVCLIGSVRDNEIIDDARVKGLWSTSLLARKECDGCFAEFHCAGGCLIRCFLTSDPRTRESAKKRCHLTRELLLAEYVRFLDKNRIEPGRVCSGPAL